MQTANENNAVTQCNLDCSPKACGRCTCQPAPHTTCAVHTKPGAYPKETPMTYGTKPVSKLKDEIYEALKYNNVGDPDIAIDPISIADAIGNHLVNTIFKDNEEYQIIE